MGVLNNVLSESHQYYTDIERKIKKALEEIPKGSIKKRLINGKAYYYLQSRVGGRVIHKYVGKQKPVELINKIGKRKKLKLELKTAKNNIKMLKKVKSK